jgi:predicted house-cleaning noncanonical NTP pyrophosphatase (MazG superfamily)
MLGILILWILAIFLTLEVISRIATASNISALKINGAWNSKRKRD